ncbi:hypothetical protein SAMN05216489_05075 [Streptomyces sp. 3213]|uniref:hypothetical protein n=1 Tax=Streptomyces TaxID=1883 RepID=UPI00036CBDAB|nr:MULTISPECIES: hypothetical protein [Streptomyces]SED96864.1 hypothetical protein SAMN05216489_05075 [Streptomyces sp. 3213] [Streptomyces sp. 3213.3]
MGYVVLALLLTAGAAFAVVAQRRSHRPRALSDLDAEVEASGWVLRLGASLSVPEARLWAGAGETATRALTAAAECHRAAGAQLSAAHTADEYAQATHLAQEGLAHIATARAALGSGPVLADSAA